MSYVAPTAAELKERFPALNGASDAVVVQALTEALTVVGQCWVSQDDYTLGSLLYAAHTLTLDGHGTGTEAQMAAGGMLGFDSITSGKLSVRRASTDAGGADSILLMTQYGKRFIEVRNRNVFGVRVIG